MLQDSIKYLQDRGCTSIGLDAVPKAASLYIKQGFVNSGKRISWYTLTSEMIPKLADPSLMHHCKAISKLERNDVEGLDRLVSLDTTITGFRRSKVFHELINTHNWHFWTISHVSKGISSPDEKFSYIGARPIPGGFGIGPIYAHSLEDAIKLLRNAIACLTRVTQTHSQRLHFAVEACSYNSRTEELFKACGWRADDYHYHVGQFLSVLS